MDTIEPRALRWERRPEERPGELLDAALRVFAERGYRNTRLEEVAEAAGVTKGAIYHYFATKEELLLRAIDAYHERAFGRLEEALRGETGPASVRISVMMRKAFGASDPARRAMLVLLQGVAADVPEAHLRWLANGPVKGWQLIQRMIVDGQAAGEFRADVDAEVAARMFVSGMLLQTLWQQYAPSVPAVAIDEDRLIDSAVEIFLHGLRPSSPQ